MFCLHGLFFPSIPRTAKQNKTKQKVRDVRSLDFVVLVRTFLVVAQFVYVSDLVYTPCTEWTALVCT